MPPSPATRLSHSAYDVVIVGAGPAGLSAALVLGRACRRVLLCDRGTPRSWASLAVHGYLGHDGVAPDEFRRIARAELARYPQVRFRRAEVTRAHREGVGFVVEVGGRKVGARKVLLATGLMDVLPPLPDIAALYGHSVFVCPYCDGYELQGAALAAYGRGARGLHMARALTAWSRDVVLLTDGPAKLPRQERAQLAANGVPVIETPIAALERRGGQLTAIRFDDGARLARRALFFDLPARGQSALAQALGCALTRDGAIRCGRYESTTVPGVYAAGNILRDVQLSIVAAGQGASAAFGINLSLTREDFASRATGRSQVDHPGTPPPAASRPRPKARPGGSAPARDGPRAPSARG